MLAVETAKAKFGGVHGLVNCAGIAPSERIAGRNGPHSLESFTRAITINLVGTFNMLRLAASAMVGNEPMADGERGVIINTASVAAFEGQVGQVAYAASKAGVAGMTLPAARELCALRHSRCHHCARAVHDSHDGRFFKPRCRSRWRRPFCFRSAWESRRSMPKWWQASARRPC